MANPNSQKKSLFRVCVAVRTFTQYGQHIRDGVLEYVGRGHDWELYLERVPGNNTSIVSASQLDGLIVESSIDYLTDFPGPTVHVAGDISDVIKPAVITDNAMVGRIAAEHFLNLGFKQLGFYGPVKRHKVALTRLTSFLDVAKKHNIPVDVLDCSHPSAHHSEMTGTWLRGLPKPVGVFAATDEQAVVLSRLCRKHDIAVPEAVSILGVDDDEFLCRSALPPLSSIDHGAFKIGFEAAAMLDQLLNGHDVKQQLVVVNPVGLVNRRSTDTLAIANPMVAQAMQYIRENACKGITVADVCQSLPESRRSLELAFRKSIDRTIHEEIHRIRVTRAMELLAKTDIPIADICERSGFSYPSRLATSIRRQTGQTPREYRRQHRAV